MSTQSALTLLLFCIIVTLKRGELFFFFLVYSYISCACLQTSLDCKKQHRQQLNKKSMCTLIKRKKLLQWNVIWATILFSWNFWISQLEKKVESNWLALLLLVISNCKSRRKNSQSLWGCVCSLLICFCHRIGVGYWRKGWGCWETKHATQEKPATTTTTTMSTTRKTKIYK